MHAVGKLLLTGQDNSFYGQLLIINLKYNIKSMLCKIPKGSQELSEWNINII